MDTTPLRFSVSALRRRACPVATPPWPDVDPVRPEDVRQALSDQRFHAEPLGPQPVSREERAARIAFLMEAGWEEPIEIDVGVPGFPGHNPLRWIIDDGNHRLYAAIMQGDNDILGDASGLQSEIDGLLLEPERAREARTND